VTNPLSRWLIDQAMSWLLDDFRRALVFGAVMVVGALVVMFWLGRVTLRPPVAEPEELPQALDEALDNAAGQDYRGRRRRKHFAPPVAHRPHPGARRASNCRLAWVLRHRTQSLPVVRIAVPVGTGLYASQSGSDDTTVAVDLRAQQTEVLADGEVHRG
jgi:hypothetical protein